MPAEVSEGETRAVLPSASPSSPPPLPPPPPAEPPAVEPTPPLPPAAFVEGAGRCANCLTPLAGPFCWHCGQHVADYHRSVWRFVTDFFENAFSWDNKFFRTLVPLLRRPGWLTQEFMAGRRVRYVHPLRLFLFTSAICLALLQWTHNTGAFQARTSRSKSIDSSPPVAVPPARSKADDEDEEATDNKPADASPTPGASALPSASPSASPAEESISSILHDTIKVDANKEAKVNRAAQAALDKRWEDFGDRMQKKFGAAGDLEKFNERMTTNVQSKLSWVALGMLPIFALLMRMFFGTRGGYYFTYLVFSLHYHTFLLLFWVAYAWVDAVAKYAHSDLLRVFTALCLFVPPWYLFRALRQMYGQGWSVTAAKVFAIGAVHLLTLFAGLGMIGATAFL